MPGGSVDWMRSFNVLDSYIRLEMPPASAPYSDVPAMYYSMGLDSSGTTGGWTLRPSPGDWIELSNAGRFNVNNFCKAQEADQFWVLAKPTAFPGGSLNVRWVHFNRMALEGGQFVIKESRQLTIDTGSGWQGWVNETANAVWQDGSGLNYLYDSGSWQWDSWAVDLLDGHPTVTCRWGKTSTNTGAKPVLTLQCLTSTTSNVWVQEDWSDGHDSAASAGGISTIAIQNQIPGWGISAVRTVIPLDPNDNTIALRGQFIVFAWRLPSESPNLAGDFFSTGQSFLPYR
jgi:hypothetical protein